MRTLAAALLLAACSSPRPTVEQALAEEDLGVAARKAQERADAQPGSFDAQLGASRAFFLVADRELRRGLIEDLDRRPATDLDELVVREANLPAELKGRVATLGEASARYGLRAISVDDSRADARFYYAAGLGLEAWGKGPAAALLEGLPSKVIAAIDAAVAADPSFGNGAPLRARSAFYGRAPWPLGNKDKALEAAERAAAIGNTVLGNVYLAEALWRKGEKDQAIAAWQRAVVAPAGTIAVSDDYAREFARRAVALSGA